MATPICGSAIRRAMACAWAIALGGVITTFLPQHVQDSKLFVLPFGAAAVLVCVYATRTFLLSISTTARLVEMEDPAATEPLILLTRETNIRSKQIGQRIAHLIEIHAASEFQLSDRALDTLAEMVVRSIIRESPFWAAMRKIGMAEETVRFVVRPWWGKGYAPDAPETVAGVVATIRLLEQCGASVQYRKICQALEVATQQGNPVSEDILDALNRWVNV